MSSNNSFDLVGLDRFFSGTADPTQEMLQIIWKPERIARQRQILPLAGQNLKRCRVDVGKFDLAPSSFVVTVNEAWRGEVSHCVITDDSGKIVRYKIKDPSFHNWNGLAMSLRDTGISDFPLNNKSFNLSYCGFDL